jgi:hypothetical protein
MIPRHHRQVGGTETQRVQFARCAGGRAHILKKSH